ncbi:MAG: HAD-IA family hydrolase [Pseudomonadota bacterium]
MSKEYNDKSGAVSRPYDAVVFDLLTALIDSWTLWNDIAGSETDGMRWRSEYLRLTYGAGSYRDYESIVAEAASAAGLSRNVADDLSSRWQELTPWPGATDIVAGLARRCKVAVVTNCSVRLGRQTASLVYSDFDIVMTAEEAGFYKPRREPYAKTLAALGTDPKRTLFVAGSAADVPGASALGMPVYWHNRVGLPPTDDAKPLYHERTLDRLREIA